MKKITLLVSSMLAFSGAFAQVAEEQGKSEVAYPLTFGESRPLSEIAAEEPFEEFNDANNQLLAADNESRKKNAIDFKIPVGPEYATDESTIQRTMGTRAPATPVIKDWAGQTGNYFPIDPSGAVGPNHYVQAINATPVRVYNKTTGATLLTTQLGNLWSPTTVNKGDPIVLYDKTADRWFIAQFSHPSTIVYIAVSKTADPTGAYWTYSFTTTTANDYLKFSIWHDGYYMTTNGTNKIYVFERSAMLTGSPSARQVSTTYSHGVSGQGASFFCPLSADADGTLPTSGPCPMVYPVENVWGASSDGINVRNMTVNWSGTPSLTISASNIIPTNSHDMSYANGWLDIPQPGTTQKLDAIGGVATFRAQWRQWTGYNSLLLVFTVKISATQRAPKWVELRQTGGTWAKYQEGVYQPDTKSRFIPSIAMDNNGNIGMGYARSSSTSGDFPSLGYCGRLKNDPIGTMSIAETMVPGGAGNSSQYGAYCGAGCERFGDYSQTSIDPTNGLVFWHTGQYSKSGSGQETRIFSFQLQASGIDDETGENASLYNVYQSQNILNVEANKLISNETTQVDLFDITGREVVNQKINPVSNALKTTIDVTGLATGTYFVRIGNIEYQKVIKVFVK